MLYLRISPWLWVLFVLLPTSLLAQKPTVAPAEMPQRMVRTILQAETAWPEAAQESLQVALEQLTGVEFVRLEPRNLQIIVAYQPADNTTDAIAAELEKLGHPVKVLMYPPHEDPARQAAPEQEP